MSNTEHRLPQEEGYNGFDLLAGALTIICSCVAVTFATAMIMLFLPREAPPPNREPIAVPWGVVLTAAVVLQVLGAWGALRIFVKSQTTRIVFVLVAGAFACVLFVWPGYVASFLYEFWREPF